MGKPLIIFGAGASHSLLDMRSTHIHEQLHPPLTNGLFEERFSDIISRYDLMQERLHEIEERVESEGNLEGYLAYLDAQESAHTQKQLIEIQLYLNELFKKISSTFIKSEFFKSNHYVAFLRALSEVYDEACIVTFNYDLFLDKSMGRVFKYKYERDISSYYDNRNFPLYKVHGSVDWGYMWAPLTSLDTLEKKVEFLLRHKQENTPRQAPVLIREGYISPSYFVSPALYIPVPNDKGFILPTFEDHITDNIKKADKIIIIGWSARDEYFTKILKKNINYDETKIIVVAPAKIDYELVKSPSEADEIIARLSHSDESKKWKKKPLPLSETFSSLANDSERLKMILED